MTMRDCPDGTLRDALPLYVSGRLAVADTSRIDAHLGSCAECTAEVALLRAVGRAYPPTPVNVAAVAARIPARRAPRKQVAFHRQPLWQIAAGITLLITGTATVMVVRGRAPQAPSLASAPSAAGTAAEATIAAVTPPAPARTVTTSSAVLSLGTDLSDLTDAQLQSLLVTLDAIDSRPGADPATIARPIIQDRTQAPGRSNQ